MIQATFTVPAQDFTPAFVATIQPYLGAAETVVVVQVRTKRKISRRKPTKNGSSEPILNGSAQAQPEVFVRKYPSQPTPEESDRIIAEMRADQNRRAGISLEDQIRDRKPFDEEEWFRRIEALNITEPIEDLLAMLTK